MRLRCSSSPLIPFQTAVPARQRLSLKILKLSTGVALFCKLYFTYRALIRREYTWIDSITEFLKIALLSF